MSGKHEAISGNLTWDDYKKWQRWDEWPERTDNPPMTVETNFFYRGKEYMVTSLRGVYVIVSMPDFTELIVNSNFLDLLNMPFIDGKSFKELIEKFEFDL